MKQYLADISFKSRAYRAKTIEKNNIKKQTDMEATEYMYKDVLDT